MLIAALIFVLPACSKPEPEPEPEPEEEVEEEIDYSIYADESLGIDGKVGADLRDYRNILIAGIDNGNRSDMLIVLSINKNTGDAKMFTVSRDTYMQIAHGDTVTIGEHDVVFCKCNRAFEIGDKYDLMKELNRHLDLNIKEFIGVDWPCTADLVDALGGVECDIESEAMLDAINTLITNSSVGYAEPISGTGMQKLTGWQTVHYLRVRKFEGGSAAVREERNRGFLNSLYNRAKDMSIDEIAEIYDDIADELDTNMSRDTLTETLVQLESASITDIGGWPFELKMRWEPDKFMNYKVPQTLSSNVTELHEKLFDQAGYEPSATVQDLNDQILDLEENYLK